MTNLGRTTLDSEIANHVLWHFAEGGYRPGSFVQSLLDTITRADPENRALLETAFPGYVRAVTIAKNQHGGIGQLQALASGVPS